MLIITATLLFCQTTAHGLFERKHKQRGGPCRCAPLLFHKPMVSENAGVHKIQNRRKFKEKLRHFASENGAKSRPAFPDGLGCTLGRLLGGGRAGALFLLGRDGQLPVQRILVVLQVGAIGQQYSTLFFQTGQIRNLNSAAGRSTFFQVGITQLAIEGHGILFSQSCRPCWQQ